METRTGSGSLSRASRALLIATVVVGLAHHTDHVLRVDHSGWPFRPNVNPFSLLAYPIGFFALLGPLRLFWLRWLLLLAGNGFTLFAHTFIESPAMQYAMWAHNRSLEPQYAGIHNLLDMHSTAMGMAAVTVSMVLNILLVISTASMLMDGLRDRRVRPAAAN